MAISYIRALLPLIALFSFLGFAFCEESLTVTGNVYCDTCRAGFVTSLSQSLKGAKVKLECRDEITEDVSYTVEGETDPAGYYKLTVDGDHEEEICEVQLVKSSDSTCNEILPGLGKARVLITANNGISGSSRFVNSLGFFTKEPLKECAAIIKDMGIIPHIIPTKA